MIGELCNYPFTRTNQPSNHPRSHGLPPACLCHLEEASRWYHCNKEEDPPFQDVFWHFRVVNLLWNPSSAGVICRSNDYHGNGGRGIFWTPSKKGLTPWHLRLIWFFGVQSPRIFGIPSNFILQNQVKGNLKVVIWLPAWVIFFEKMFLVKICLCFKHVDLCLV